MKTINPKALKQIRQKRGWSHAELERRAKIGKRRLIELEKETAEFHEMRDGNFADLCRALSATPAQLRGEEPITDPMPANHVTLRSKITTVAQMNYDLISAQYGVESDQIVQLAPLMFAILVEDSFAWRKEQLELRKQIQDLKKQVLESLNDPDPSVTDGTLKEDLLHEEVAILKREVFSRPWYFAADAVPEDAPVSDRFTDFIAARVNASEGRIRADLMLDYFKGRDIRDPDTKYIAVPELFESLTVPDDVQSTAKLRTCLMSGAMRWSDLFGADDRTADQLAEWFKSEVKPKADALEAVIAPEVYRFDTETEGLSLDEMGFPIRVRRAAGLAAQSQDEGDENASS